MTKVRSKIFFLAVLPLVVLSVGFAQVTISPTSLFIDNQRRFETLLVLNSTSDQQEISISYEFGFPVSDEFGNVRMNYTPDETTMKYSIAEWVKGFPKSFILEPGQRQTVRITIRPPANLPDGTYWARVKTASNALTPPVGAPVQDQITAQINFKFEQVTSVFYKTGQLSTSLVIDDIRHEFAGDKLMVYADLIKSGNSPYLGSMELVLKDQSGKSVKQEQVFISVYLGGTRRIEVDMKNLPSGEYNAVLSLITERGDIAQEYLIHAEPVQQTFQIIK